MIKDEKLQLHLGVGNYGFNGLLFSLQQPYFNHLLTRNDDIFQDKELKCLKKKHQTLRRFLFNLSIPQFRK
jgi:hypothetical protein